MGGSKEIQKKIILLGDGAVGKTSLIRRFVVDRFDDKYILTIGSKITAKSLQIEKDKDLIDGTFLLENFCRFSNSIPSKLIKESKN